MSCHSDAWILSAESANSTRGEARLWTVRFPRAVVSPIEKLRSSMFRELPLNRRLAFRIARGRDARDGRRSVALLMAPVPEYVQLSGCFIGPSIARFRVIAPDPARPSAENPQAP